MIARGPAGDCCMRCGRVGVNLPAEHGCQPDVPEFQYEYDWNDRHKRRDGRGPEDRPATVRATARPSAKAFAGLLRTVADAEVGRRDTILFWAAGKAAEAGYNRPAAYEALAEMGRMIGQSEYEIRRALRELKP